MDFLDFRDMLRPASGFQSWQFKELEAKLGLKFENRHGKEYYTAQLRKEHVDVIKKAEGNRSLLELINSWLERMPLAPPLSDDPNSFWQIYRESYQGSLLMLKKEIFQHLTKFSYPEPQTSPKDSADWRTNLKPYFLRQHREPPYLSCFTAVIHYYNNLFSC